MPHKTIVIRRLIRTGERCPSQWEATTEDGLYLYVRYRWGCLEIGMGPSMHDAIENSGNVFEKQLGMLGKMGSLDKLMGAFPGMAGRVKDEDLATTQVRLKKFKVILTSMTDEEKTDPKLIKSSRVVRIARGSGTHPREVKELLKHFNMSRKAVKGLAGNRKMRKQLMKQLGAAGMDMKD